MSTVLPLPSTPGGRGSVYVYVGKNQMQDKVDYLTDDKRADYREWEDRMLRRAEQILSLQNKQGQ